MQQRDIGEDFRFNGDTIRVCHRWPGVIMLHILGIQKLVVSLARDCEIRRNNTTLSPTQMCHPPSRFKLCPWQRYTRGARLMRKCILRRHAPEDYVTAMTG